jgi:WD40 repeat protein
VLRKLKVGTLGNLVYSPNGKRLAVCTDKLVKVFDADTGQELLILRGHEANVQQAVFSRTQLPLPGCTPQ